jgi:triacylglycerol lipase
MLDKGFSKSNAEFFSSLSMNAYLNISEFSDIYSDDYDIKFFNYGSTQCYALWDDNDLIYAFRGTELTKLSDIRTDIRFRKTEASEDSFGKVHRGFKDGLDLIWDDLLSHYDNYSPQVSRLLFKRKLSTKKNIFLTGHSLGAALATIAGGRLDDENIYGYTYGSPRVGNSKFRDSFRPKFFRFRNNNDIVTRQPPEMIGYTHVGHLNYFDRKGNHVYGFSRWYMFKQYVLGMLIGLKNFEIDSFWDHPSSKYYELCKKFNSKE